MTRDTLPHGAQEISQHWTCCRPGLLRQKEVRFCSGPRNVRSGLIGCPMDAPVGGRRIMMSSYWEGQWSTLSREQWHVAFFSLVLCLYFHLGHPWWQGDSFCLALSLLQDDCVWWGHPVKLWNLKVGVAKTGINHTCQQLPFSPLAFIY